MMHSDARERTNRFPQSADPLLPRWKVPRIWNKGADPRDDLSGETGKGRKKPGTLLLKVVEISDRRIRANSEKVYGSE